MSTSQEEGAVFDDWPLSWRLRRALLHARMTPEEMAGHLEVSKNTVTRWMREEDARPNHLFIQEWARRTGVSYNWLMSGVPNVAPTPPRTLVPMRARKRPGRRRLTDNKDFGDSQPKGGDGQKRSDRMTGTCAA